MRTTYPRQHPPARGPHTWWGKAWGRAVEEAAYAQGDLKRGRAIARRGEVGGISVDAGSLLAAVREGDDAWTVTVAMPVLARNVLESIRLLATASRTLATRCVDGITADAERMRRYAESSPSVVTPLNRLIGYEAAAKIAKQALADGATIRETVLAQGYVERGEISLEQLDAALDVESMTR